MCGWRAIRSMPRFVYFLVCRKKRGRGTEQQSRRSICAGLDRSLRQRERRDTDETIQFDGRRAAPRTDRTIRENDSNRNLVETHSRGSFDPSVGPAAAGPPVELKTRLALWLCDSV